MVDGPDALRVIGAFRLALPRTILRFAGGRELTLGDLDGNDHAACARRLALVDPPRFCAACARRMVVQVTPVRWTARCSRHGEIASAR